MDIPENTQSILQWVGGSVAAIGSLFGVKKYVDAQQDKAIERMGERVEGLEERVEVNSLDIEVLKQQVADNTKADAERYNDIKKDIASVGDRVQDIYKFLLNQKEK